MFARLGRFGASLALLVAAVLPTACQSFPLPPAPSAADMQLAASTHFHATVAVVPYKDRFWSFNLLESLRATKLFDRVGMLGDIQNPDLLARVREPARPGEPWMILPTLTLGVIPAFASDVWGEMFSLYAATDERRSVPVDFRVTGSQHVGWIALFTGMAPNRTWMIPCWTRRYRDALSVKICRGAPEIRALIAEARKRRR